MTDWIEKVRTLKWTTQTSCIDWGCRHGELTEQQRAEAHYMHLTRTPEEQREYAENDDPQPTVPDVAFCDKTGHDKTHHASPMCSRLVENRELHGLLYIPRTNARVIRALFPKGCDECV